MKRSKGRKTMLHRAPLILIALILLQGHALADRGDYTLEMVENADIIGIWSKENAIEKNGVVSLEKPEILLKGSMDSLPTKLDPGTSAALLVAFNHLNENDDRLIVLVGIPRPEQKLPAGTAHLIKQFAYNHYNDLAKIQLQALKRIIDQVEIAQKWSKLSPKLKIEHSDIIVSGHITHDESLEDSNYFIQISKIYRGAYSGQRLEVLPALQKVENILPGKLLSLPVLSFKITRKDPNAAGGTRATGDGVPTGRIKGSQALFFIQRYYGTGPEYILMAAVDVNKAGQYLTLFK
jgi:hypothetical protein